MNTPIVKKGIKVRKGISQKALQEAVRKLTTLENFERRYAGNAKAHNQKMKDLTITYHTPWKEDRFLLSAAELKAIQQLSSLVGVSVATKAELTKLNNDDD